MILNHHKVTRYRNNAGPLVEAFRKADWVDVSLGALRFGLPASIVSDVRAAFPNAGFHRRLAELTFAQMRREPLRPLPMFRW